MAALPARTRLAAGAGAAVAGLSRALGRGGGSVVGGRTTLALDPRALEHLASGHRTALVSGTNGKTTTTSLLHAGLATTGPLITNVLGANLPPGITAALVAGPAGVPAVLEVDEAWLGRVADATSPEVVLLLNLSRDQLDRNNEVRHLAATWRTALTDRPGTTVIANADDPLVVWGAGAAREVIWVGAGQPWTADAAGCPNCGSRIIFEPTSQTPDQPAAATPEEPGAGTPDRPAAVTPNQSEAGSAGKTAGSAGETAGSAGEAAGSAAGWACSSCDLRRPPLAVTVAGREVVSADGWSAPLRMALPGRCNRANAALALAAAVRMGADPERAASAMAATAEVVGRYRTFDAGGVDARLLLSKNPAGWLEVFDMLAPAPAPVVIAINARIADGRDPSWLWDVPFEALAGRQVIATGERSRDLAVRLHYAEVAHTRVDDLMAAVHHAGRLASSAQTPPPQQQRGAPRPTVDVVANYTSFQQLRSRLGAP